MKNAKRLYMALLFLLHIKALSLFSSSQPENAQIDEKEQFIKSIRNVAFDASMAHSGEYLPSDAIINPEWQTLKSLYETYQSKLCLREECIIPKWIHVIWLGSPLPECSQKLVDTWKEHHPDWKIKIWTDEDVSSFGFTNRAAFDSAKNYAEKSDIWRYEILYRYGGVYIDTDFECLQPLDDLHKSCEFYAGLGQTKRPELLIGIIGSIPSHPILKALIENIKIGPGDNDPWRILDQTGPYFFTRIFLAVASTCCPATVVPFPLTFFYPFPHTKRHYLDQTSIKLSYIKPESMAIHYFESSWQKKQPFR